jgi:hypothetical protein
VVVLDETEAIYVVIRSGRLAVWLLQDGSAVFAGDLLEPTIIGTDDAVNAGSVLEDHVAARAHVT